MQCCEFPRQRAVRFVGIRQAIINRFKKLRNSNCRGSLTLRGPLLPDRRKKWQKSVNPQTEQSQGVRHEKDSYIDRYSGSYGRRCAGNG
jgi:hypothetical protein